jgi:ACS family tartrate transporter-like MFS transporter
VRNTGEAVDRELRTLAKVRRYILGYIIVGQLFVQLDRTNIGFATLTMSHDLAIKATVFGFASGVFALGAFFAQVPAGLALERLGPRRWLTTIMITWGCISCAQAFVHNDVQLIVLRFLLGTMEASFVPGAYVLISLWFRGQKHGTAISAVQIGTALSGVLGAPFAGFLLSHTLLGIAGWRGLFLIEGGLTILLALIGFYILWDGPDKCAWLKSNERSVVAGYLAGEHAPAMSTPAGKASLWEMVKDWRIVLLVLAYTCAGWVSATFAFFIPTLLKAAGTGLDPQTIGYMAMVPYFVMAVMALTWAAHADKTERHWHCVIPLLISALGILIYTVHKTPLIAMLCLAMVQAGSTGFFVTFWPSCGMLVGKRTLARATALITAGTQAASFAAPVVFGWALEATGRATIGLYICIGVLLLNFVIMNVFFFNFKRDQRRIASMPHA